MTDQIIERNRKRLLVVEDNPELAKTYQELLSERGFEVSLATNGVQALKFILSNEVDAILCDLSMPQLEGDMFHMTVKRVRPGLEQRFVFVTGNVGNPKFEEFCKNVGCPVLYKPVSLDKLVKVMNGLFGSS